MSTARVVVGVVLVLLGLLWIVQGADLIRLRPILCAAECAPVTGGLLGWFTVGVVTFVVGLRLAGALRR